MPANRSFGTPKITDFPSVQFWMQHLFNRLDELAGLRGTPQFHAPIDMRGNQVKNAAPADHPMDAVVKDQLDTTHSQLSSDIKKKLDADQAVLQTQTLHETITNETTIALAAQAFPVGGIIVWHLADPGTIPSGWHICDGTGGTPTIADIPEGLHFIMKT